MSENSAESLKMMEQTSMMIGQPSTPRVDVNAAWEEDLILENQVKIWGHQLYNNEEVNMVVHKRLQIQEANSTMMEFFTSCQNRTNVWMSLGIMLKSDTWVE